MKNVNPMIHKCITTRLMFTILIIAILFSAQTAIATDGQTQSDIAVPTGDLRVDVDTEDGDPVANVYVVVDGDQNPDKYTNGFGSYYQSGIVQGSHDVAIMYYDNKTQSIYAKSQTVNILSGINSLKFTATIDAAYKVQSSVNGTGTDGKPTIAPIIVVGAAITVFGVYLDVSDFCNCAYPGEGLTACLSDLATCKGDNACVSIARNKYVSKMSECKLESVFLAADVVPMKAATVPFKYLFVLYAKELKRVDTFADISKVWFDSTEGVWKFTKKLGDYWTNFFTKLKGIFFKTYIVKGTENWADEAHDGIKRISEKFGGHEIAEKFVTVLRDEFGEEYAERILVGIGKLESNGVIGLHDTVENGLKQDGLVDDVYRAAENVQNARMTGDTVALEKYMGNLRGKTFEIEVASHPKYIDRVKEVSRRYYNGNGNPITEADVLLGDSIIEAKWGGYSKFKIAESDVNDKIRKLTDAKGLNPELGNKGIIFEFKTRIVDDKERALFEEFMNKKVTAGEIKSWGYLE